MVYLAIGSPASAAEASNVVGEDVYSFPCSAPDFGEIPGKGSTESVRQRQIDPGHPVARSLGPYDFHVPWGYLLPRPFSTHLNCDPRVEKFGFQFWIPSLDAPERDMWFVPEFKPEEMNREKPAANEWVVKVVWIEFEDGERSEADTRLDNVTRSRPRDATVPSEEFGLTKLQNGRNGGTRYYYEKTPDRTLLFRCFGEKPGSVCQGYTHFKDLRLGATIHAPLGALSQHRTITDGMRTLVERWRR